MPELTDLSYVRALCEKYDFALSKGFGQNFIINPGIPQKIVDVSGVDKRYGVIEIGPGIGVLTRELAKRAEDRGVTYCLEIVNRFEQYLLNTAEEAVACRPCWLRRWLGWTILNWSCRTC